MTVNDFNKLLQQSSDRLKYRITLRDFDSKLEEQFCYNLKDLCQIAKHKTARKKFKKEIISGAYFNASNLTNEILVQLIISNRQTQENLKNA